MELKTAISNIHGVGKTVAARLKRLGLFTVRDLLYYFPFRYEDFRRLALVKDLQPGNAVTVRVKVTLLGSRRSYRRKMILTEGIFSDESGSVRAVWFNQPFIAKILTPGSAVYLSGTPKLDEAGLLFSNPTYEKVTSAPATHTARLVPIYGTTSGVTQKQLRFLTKAIFDDRSLPPVSEWIPEVILRVNQLVALPTALRGIHFPSAEEDLAASRRRLKFGELLLVQLQANAARAERQRERAPAILFRPEETKSFVRSLPFKLTLPQRRSAWEILQDLSRSIPMNRLLSGDVGSGKTVVAAIALYNAALNGWQAALMAPTEILARQHFATVAKLLSGLNVKVGLLTRSQAEKSESQNSKSKKEVIKEINSGLIKIAVGTQALLGEGVKFSKLGLVIVDEQHRFGVEQRRLMKKKGRGAHLLSMTATPIPRSLALTLFGDLDVSLITSLPPGRKTVITRLVEAAKRAVAYQFIRGQVKAGRQVFVVCPLVDSGQTTSDVRLNDKKSVLSEYEKLTKQIFPDLKVRYIHGRLPSKDKEAVMADFRAGQFDILVATSVIEVGVDIPNASVVMVEGAEHFGLAQLHQFRGRVGRSIHQSYCLLFAEDYSEPARARLEFFAGEPSGFKVAEKDLLWRGPGEVYGVEQSGMTQLKLATLADKDLIALAREAAKEIFNLALTPPALARHLRQWRQETHLE